LEIARRLESCKYKKKAEGAWRLRGDWKTVDTKRKQRELGDCSIDDVCFRQLLRGNRRKNSRSWIVFGTSSSRGQFSRPRQTDGQTSEIIYRIVIANLNCPNLVHYASSTIAHAWTIVV
jgi:hypothetical protein